MEDIKKECKSIKELVKIWVSGTYKDYDIWDCRNSKSQLIMNYCYKKHWNIDKFWNYSFTFNYFINKLTIWK